MLKVKPEKKAEEKPAPPPPPAEPQKVFVTISEEMLQTLTVKISEGVSKALESIQLPSSKEPVIKMDTEDIAKVIEVEMKRGLTGIENAIKGIELPDIPAPNIEIAQPEAKEVEWYHDIHYDGEDRIKYIISKKRS